MNALEQEYRDNVANSRVRETRRTFILGTIGCLIIAGGFTWVDRERGALFFLVAFVHIASAFAMWRLKPAALTTPTVTTPVESAPLAIGYRDAVLPQSAPVATRSSAIPFVARTLLVLLILAGCVWLGWGDGRGRLVGYALTGIGCVVVIVTQRTHAAWKRWHDAKLMVEWERRLEEMK